MLLHWVTAWTCQKGQRQCSFHSSKCFYRVRGDWIRSLSSGGTKCTQFISENNNRKWFSGRNPANTAALRFKSTQAQWGGGRGDGVIGVSWRFRRNLRVFCHLNPLPRSSIRRSNMKRVACSQHHLLFQEHRQQQSVTVFIKDHTPQILELCIMCNYITGGVQKVHWSILHLTWHKIMPVYPLICPKRPNRQSWDIFLTSNC